MIKDPPLLRIRRGFTRPTEALLAGFAGIPTGYLVDAMNGSGCLDYRIKPLVGRKTVMVGTAVTCQAGPSDNLALFGALHAARKGDVLVAATDAYMGAAITGDLLLGMARNRGVAGFVTDGLVRDLVGILDVDIPVYCAGLTANSPARNGPGTVGMPVVLGGVRVESGDAAILRHSQQQIAGDGGRQAGIGGRHQDVALSRFMQRAEQSEIVRRPGMTGNGGAHHDGRRWRDGLDAVIEAAIPTHGIHQIAGGNAGESGEQAFGGSRKAPPDFQCGRFLDHGRLLLWVGRQGI